MRSLHLHPSPPLSLPVPEPREWSKSNGPKMTSTSTSTHSLRCILSCIHHCRQFSYIITLLVLPCNSHTFPSKSCRIINKINPARALPSDLAIQLNQLDLLVRTLSCTLRRYFIFVQNERSSTDKDSNITNIPNLSPSPFLQ